MDSPILQNLYLNQGFLSYQNHSCIFGCQIQYPVSLHHGSQICQILLSGNVHIWDFHMCGHFFSHNFISRYLHFFVTTRQSSTYKQSTSDSEVQVRKHHCIRTLVKSYDNETHNNAPKATGNGLKQCGTAITWSIFFKFSQQTTHISPVRARN